MRRRVGPDWRAGLKLTALLLAGGLAPASVEAARPLVTDDARVVEPRSCRLETWSLLSRDGDEYWAVPGCNFIAGIELSAGVALLPEEPGSGPSRPAVVVQGKTILRPLTPGSYGLGVAVGGLFNSAPVPEEDVFGNVFAYVPLTFDVYRERIFVHANGGIAYDTTDDDRVLGIWGIAGESYVGWNVLALGEVYGSSDERPFSQIGFRLSLIPDRLQFDTVVGLQFGLPVEEGWVSVGLRFLSPPLIAP